MKNTLPSMSHSSTGPNSLESILTYLLSPKIKYSFGSNWIVLKPIAGAAGKLRYSSERVSPTSLRSLLIQTLSFVISTRSPGRPIILLMMRATFERGLPTIISLRLKFLK